ncbi:MAG: hypothetical protein HY680_07330 [Chloroflexi bacterium]|nr:hypothetical protein [Chloroflexota bacterium]
MPSLLLTLHRADAYLGIALMVACALYGLASHRQHPGYLSPGYRALLIAGASVLALQVLLGLSLLAFGLRPSTILHIAIYGLLSPFILPGAYFYTRGRGKGHPNLAFALASLFLAAFLVRALFTA